MTTTDSIATAVLAHINRPIATEFVVAAKAPQRQPRICRRPTIEIPALQLEQLRAKTSPALTLRHSRPTITVAPILRNHLPVINAIAA